MTSVRASMASGEARGAARLVVASHSGFGGASLAPWMVHACQNPKNLFCQVQKKRRRDADALQTPRQREMILTNCAACAAPLAHNAPRCVRCETRYCHATCQHDHWRRGHKQICKKIHRGGGAERYHADKKYKEAVAVAAEACADG